MNWKVLLGLTLGYFVYLMIGAAVFQAIEMPPEQEQCDTVKNVVTEIKAILRNETGNITLIELANLTKVIQTASAYGIDIDEDLNVTCHINWDFQGSFFFSGTVITTIGYGHISPNTNLGRTICILYAILGIPLFAMMFSGLGERFAGLVIRLEKRIKGRAKRTWVQKIVLTLIVFTVFLVFCLLIPAAIFMAVEKWSFHDSFYYSFITITTIGFGDFVVGINPEIDYIPIYRVLVYFWILFGMAFMATVISLISEFYKETGETAKRKTGIANTEEDDGEAGEKEEEEVDQRPDGNVGPRGEDGPQDQEYTEMGTRSASQESSLHESQNEKYTDMGHRSTSQASSLDESAERRPFKPYDIAENAERQSTGENTYENMS